MTAKEESWIKTAKKQIIGTGVILGASAIVTLGSFYWKQSVISETQSADIKELKAALKDSSPDEVRKIK